MCEFYGPPHNLLPDPQTCPGATSSSGVSTVTSADDMVRWIRGYLRRACGMMRSDHSHGSLCHLARRRKWRGLPRSFGQTFKAVPT